MLNDDPRFRFSMRLFNTVFCWGLRKDANPQSHCRGCVSGKNTLARNQSAHYERSLAAAIGQLPLTKPGRKPLLLPRYVWRSWPADPLRLSHMLPTRFDLADRRHQTLAFLESSTCRPGLFQDLRLPLAQILVPPISTLLQCLLFDQFSLQTSPVTR